MDRLIFFTASIFVIYGCSNARMPDCFELSQLSSPLDSGYCVAEGYLVKEFEDYFLEARVADKDDFILIDIAKAPDIKANVQTGEKYLFEGRFERLEGEIFRLELDEKSRLERISPE